MKLVRTRGRSARTRQTRQATAETLEDRRLLAGAPLSPILQLEATDGVVYDPGTLEVSQWSDQSSSGNDVFGTGDQRPRFGASTTPSGIGAISFDGSNDRLLRSLQNGPLNGLPKVNEPRSVFLVAKFHDASSLGGASYGRFGIDKGFTVGVNSDGMLAFDSSDNPLNTSTPGLQDWIILSAVHEDEGLNPTDNLSLYSDGVEIGTWDKRLNTRTTTSSLFKGFSKSRIVIGEDLREVGHQQMDVAAWLVYDSALGQPDRETVESYLRTTYFDVDLPPNASDDVAMGNVGEATLLDVTANDSDPEDQLNPASVTIVDPSQHGLITNIDPINGVITYQHDGQSATDEFTYTVADNGGHVSNIATVSLTFNFGPNAEDDSVVLPNGTSSTIDVLANDNDVDSLIDPATVTIVDAPQHASAVTIDPDTGVVSYQHDGSGQPDSFSYTVLDEFGAISNRATVSISIATSSLPTEGLVLHLNTTLGVTYDPVSLQVDKWTDQSGSGNDLFGGNDRRPLLGSAQTPSGMPAIEFDGLDDRLVRGWGSGPISDLPALNSSRTALLVAKFYDASATGGASYGRFGDNRAYSVGVASGDPNEGKLVIDSWGEGNTLVSGADGFSPSGSEGWMILTSVHNDDGTDPADNAYLYQDGVEIGSWDSQLSTRTDVQSNLLGGVSKSRVVLGEDVRQIGHQQMDVAAWLIYDRALSNEDRLAAEAHLRSTFLDQPTMDAPTAVDDQGVANEDGPNVSVDLIQNDLPSNAALQIVAVDTSNTVGTVTFNVAMDGIDYDPAGGFESTALGEMATDSFTYTIEDPNGAADTATVTITIIGENDDPWILSDQITADDGQTTVGTIIAIDVDASDALTFSLGPNGADTALFSIEPDTGVLSFLAAPDYSAPNDANGDNHYEVGITVDDGHGGIDIRTVVVTVGVAPLIRFGAIADIQYADKDPGPHPDDLRRWYRSADQRLDEIVQVYNADADLDFVVHLGDLINDTWESYDVMLDYADGTDFNPDLLTFRDLIHPSYQIMGNHEFYNIPDTPQPDGHDDLHVRERMGFDNNIAYYDFSPAPGYRFIGLDDQVPEANPERPNSSFGLGSARPTYFDDQMAWAEQIIQDAWQANEKVVLMQHYPMVDYYNQRPDLSEWEQSVGGFIDTYPNIVAHLSGHFHSGPTGSLNGVLFETLAGVVSANPDLGQNIWYNLDLYEDHVVIDQVGENVHKGPDEDDKIFFWRTFPPAPSGGLQSSVVVSQAVQSFGSRSSVSMLDDDDDVSAESPSEPLLRPRDEPPLSAFRSLPVGFEESQSDPVKYASVPTRTDVDAVFEDSESLENIWKLNSP